MITSNELSREKYNNSMYTQIYMISIQSVYCKLNVQHEFVIAKIDMYYCYRSSFL